MSTGEAIETVFLFIGQGAMVTLQVTVVALLMGLLIGLPLALVRAYGGKAAAALVTGYSTLLRALPSILVLLILYFVIARAVNLSPFLAGALSLGIITSAYQTEVFRGAILSVGAGQMMAARAIGMSRLKAIVFIIVPQAVRLAIPAWSNEAAIVLKDSSLVYVLGVPEMLRRAEYVSARTFEPFLAFGVCAVIYFVLTFATNRGLGALERKLKIPG